MLSLEKFWVWVCLDRKLEIGAEIAVDVVVDVVVDVIVDVVVNRRYRTTASNVDW